MLCQALHIPCCFLCSLLFLLPRRLEHNVEGRCSHVRSRGTGTRAESDGGRGQRAVQSGGGECAGPLCTLPKVKLQHLRLAANLSAITVHPPAGAPAGKRASDLPEGDRERPAVQPRTSAMGLCAQAVRQHQSAGKANCAQPQSHTAQVSSVLTGGPRTHRLSCPPCHLLCSL